MSKLKFDHDQAQGELQFLRSLQEVKKDFVEATGGLQRQQNQLNEKKIKRAIERIKMGTKWGHKSNGKSPSHGQPIVPGGKNFSRDDKKEVAKAWKYGDLKKLDNLYLDSCPYDKCKDFDHREDVMDWMDHLYGHLLEENNQFYQDQQLQQSNLKRGVSGPLNIRIITPKIGVT